MLHYGRTLILMAVTALCISACGNEASDKFDHFVDPIPVVIKDYSFEVPSKLSPELRDLIGMECKSVRPTEQIGWVPRCILRSSQEAGSVSAIFFRGRSLNQHGLNTDFLGPYSKLNYVNIASISEDNLAHRLNLVSQVYGPSEKPRITVVGLETAQSPVMEIERRDTQMDVTIRCNTIEAFQGGISHLCKLSLFSNTGIRTEFDYSISDDEKLDFAALVAHTERTSAVLKELLKMKRRVVQTQRPS